MRDFDVAAGKYFYRSQPYGILRGYGDILARCAGTHRNSADLMK